MPEHVWHRLMSPAIEAEPVVEVKVTNSLKSPGKGWYLASKFGVGKVKGAGDSPSRSSR